MSVTAEGIETAEQLAAVRMAGCDHAQGFLFSRPVPSEDLREQLAHGTMRLWLDAGEAGDRLLLTVAGSR
jgi:EAL domain-containing protein (putative c-di-GMP-specific phosphodiesterase class I)